MRIYVALLVAIASATCVSGLSEIDRVRAHTPLPRRHLMAATPLGRNHVMNDALNNRAGDGGMHTRACEDFSDEDLLDVWTTLRASTNDELNGIYKTTKDKRVLSNMPAEGIVFPDDPWLQQVMHAAICIEAVNMYVHHLDEDAKEEFHALSAVPLMPEQHWEHRQLRLNENERESDVRRRYQAVEGGYLCHGLPRNANDADEPQPLRSPESPLSWAPVYQAVTAKNSTADSSLISGRRWYDYNLGASRTDETAGDGFVSLGLHLRSTGLRYMASPADRVCIILPLYIGGPVGPEWLQTGTTLDGIQEEYPWTGSNPEGWPEPPYGNDQPNTARLTDVMFRQEIDCEVWVKYDFETLCLPSSHTIFRSKVDGRPVLLKSWGGVDGVYTWTEFVAYTPLESIDPEIFAIPEYCTDDDLFPLPPTDENCDTDDAVLMEDRGMMLLQTKVSAKRAAAASERESSTLGGGAITGIIAAGAVVIVAAGVAARRLSTPPVRFAPLTASLNDDGYTETVEMSRSSMSLNQPDTPAATC